jgi:exonuclease VII small subunit
MEKFEELKSLVSSLEEDATKFYEKGNKAAGTRLRKGCQEVKNLCQDIRKEVSKLKTAETVLA